MYYSNSNNEASFRKPLMRGDIYYIEENSGAVGCEMKKTRPAVIVSNDMNNTYSSNIEIVYLTTTPKTKTLPTHMEIEINGVKSVVLCENIYTVDRSRINSERYGRLTATEKAELDNRLAISLGLTKKSLLTQQSTEQDSTIEELQKEVDALKKICSIGLFGDVERKVLLDLVRDNCPA